MCFCVTAGALVLQIKKSTYPPTRSIRFLRAQCWQQRLFYWAALSLSFRLISIRLFISIKAWGPQVTFIWCPVSSHGWRTCRLSYVADLIDDVNSLPGDPRLLCSLTLKNKDLAEWQAERGPVINSSHSARHSSASRRSSEEHYCRCEKHYWMRGAAQ